MMRKTFKNLLSAAVPVGQYLTSVKPGGAEWAPELAVLKQHNVANIGCWKALTTEARNSMPLSPEVKKVLNAGAEKIVVGGAKRLAILYGSQTGTAETYAKMLGTYAVSHGMMPVVCSMNEGAAMLAKEGNAPDAVVFVCSTYGTGEFPSNAQDFWKALSGDKLSVLSTVPHAILGLGNSHNDDFNAAAKMLSTKLTSMGSPSLLRMQLSCELQSNGHDLSFRGWKKSLWGALGQSTEGASVLKATYAVTECLAAKAEAHIWHSGFVKATIHQNSLMTPAG